MGTRWTSTRYGSKSIEFLSWDLAMMMPESMPSGSSKMVFPVYFG